MRAASPRITFFMVFCLAAVSWSIGTSLPRSTFARKVAPVISGNTYQPVGSHVLRDRLRCGRQGTAMHTHLKSMNWAKPPSLKDAVRSAIFWRVQKNVIKRGACANIPMKLLSGCTSCFLNSRRSLSVWASVAAGLENMFNRRRGKMKEENCKNEAEARCKCDGRK